MMRFCKSWYLICLAGGLLAVNPVTCEFSKLERIGCLSDEDCGSGQYCYVNDIGYGACL